MNTTLSRLLLAAVAGPAAAQPASLDARTGGILVGDQTTDSITLARDLNGDGDALDPGEITLYLDESNASGVAGPFGDVFTIFQSATGFVYIGEGASDAVYRAFDANGDGDVLDAGEVSVWFSGPGNGDGWDLPTPSGVWETEPGVVWVLNAGTVNTPGDAIFRTRDLNGDGDANDDGEAVRWFDIEFTGIGSTPFELVFIGERAFWTDLLGSATDAILWAEDLNGNGVIGVGEWGTLIDADNPYGAPIGFALKTDGVSLFVANNLSSAEQTVFRLTDLDHSGSIDAPAEAVQIWNETLLPAGGELGSVFTIALGPDGSLAVGSSGSDAADAVYLLTDSSGDGAFLEPGETRVFVGPGTGDEPAQRVRAVEFVLPPCAADINGDGTLDFFDVQAFLGLFAGQHPAADLNADGVFDFFDVQEFLNRFAAGC